MFHSIWTHSPFYSTFSYKTARDDSVFGLIHGLCTISHECKSKVKSGREGNKKDELKEKKETSDKSTTNLALSPQSKPAIRKKVAQRASVSVSHVSFILAIRTFALFFSLWLPSVLLFTSSHLTFFSASSHGLFLSRLIV